MIRSMTGFGQGAAEVQGLRVTVEMRSVNNRYTDFRFRMPPDLAAREAELRRKMLAAVRRGRVEIAVGVEHLDGQDVRPTLNLSLLQEALSAAVTLREEHGVEGDLDVATILGLPGMFRLESPELSWGEQERDALFTAFDKALQALVEDRGREGSALEKEILGRLRSMSRTVTEVRGHASAVPGQLREKLLQRLQGLGADVDLDPARLAQEATYLADRADVTEEIVRLEGHLEQARTLLEHPDGQPLGKRLDFLVQEIHRETNTICSKSPNLELTRGALALKADSEKVREQVQNLE